MVGLTLLKFFGAIILLFAISNILDWVFHGSKLAQKYFAAHPEIWRPAADSADNKKIEQGVVSAALCITAIFSFCFALAFIILQPGVIFANDWVRAAVVGGSLWLIAPVPIILTNHLYIKYHKRSTLLALLGWLVKLFLASLIMSLLF